MRDKDKLTRFLVESADVRGHLAHLDDSWLEARDRADYPPVIEQVLGEAFAAAVLLAATIKFDGKMTLQIRGSGSVYLLVVQVRADRKIRGLAKWSDIPVDESLQGLFGADARMTITIEATEFGEPYQGIVALEGACLSDALQHYFLNSEQLDTELILTVQGGQASGLLLQKLPGETRDMDGWNRTVNLARTLETDELVSLDAKTLLHRLYHQEDVRLFEPGAIEFECSCSRERTDGLVVGLGRGEAESILEEQGMVEVICEFCNAEYRYDSIDVTTLFTPGVETGDAEPEQFH